ncbi:MAG: LLM class flavin-dependent oxidoreductase [Streptosporangiales bacterium]|nr:LLM class flavin-dependent oxidoreductase [Streptosporangiales bacterium]
MTTSSGRPTAWRAPDKTFIDAFVTLAAISAVTEGMVLGTGVVIPIRWPLKLAQEFSSLSFLNGGKVVAGVGLGFSPAEFAGAGFDVERREEILVETVAIFRDAWDDGLVDFHGQVFDVDDVELFPTPVEPIPVVYGGNTPKSIRRAVDHTDGWYPGRLPMSTLEARLRYLEDYAGERASEMHTIIQPLVVVAPTREAAVAKVPVDEVAHSSGGAKFWLKPPSGEFRTVEDLRGLVVCGTPDDVVEQVMEFHDLGIDELVFDLRLQFDEYEDAHELLGAEVLPALRAALASPRGATATATTTA